MSRERNLADPDYEPTDAELEGLFRRAFAAVPAEQERAREKLRADIESARGGLEAPR